LKTSLCKKKGLIANTNENIDITMIGPYDSPNGPLILLLTIFEKAYGNSPLKKEASNIIGNAPSAPPTVCNSYVDYTSSPNNESS
jgi:uncharacterized FlgJ-related protein